MKILLINVCTGCLSTGKIVSDIAKQYELSGHECVVAYGRHYLDTGIKTYKISDNINTVTDGVLSTLFDSAGFNSKRKTKRFIKWAEEYDPDILWIHNIHGYYINVELLFDWIKSRPNMEVKWTLHDCWPFTGHCAHFSVACCYKWKDNCGRCPEKHKYPICYGFDRSKNNLNRKKLIFSDVKKMTLFTPSNWLKELVQQSFLNQYNVIVNENKVDTKIFHPRLSDFRKKNKLENKIVLLGVASVWTKEKGLYDLYELANRLDEQYKIIIVGTINGFRKPPESVTWIKRTYDQIELAEIYSSADYFVNPSKQETFGMTTLEAIYCGTKAIVYEGTACEEVVKNNAGNGFVVSMDNGVDNIISIISKSNK